MMMENIKKGKWHNYKQVSKYGFLKVIFLRLSMPPK